MIFPLLLAVFLPAFASAVPRELVARVKESIIPPREWTRQGRAPSHLPIELRIALPQPNFSELERHLYEIR